MINTRCKETNIEEIPEDWEISNVGKICDVGTGSRNTQDRVEYGKYPFFVRSQEVERINSYSYDCEAVLTAGDGVGTGKVFHYIDGKFDAHQRVYVMTHFVNNVDGKFFYWYFSKKFHNRVHLMTAKSSVDSVRKEMITEMELLLPPLKEQQRIAVALSEIDALLLVLNKKIEKKKLIKQGIMQQLLTAKKRLAGFTEPWEEEKLGKKSYICRGGSPRPISYFLTDDANGINWIKIGDVTIKSKYINKTAERIKQSGASCSRKVYKGDFILSNSMSFGRPYILNIDGCIHDGWLVIQEYQEYYNIDFLYYILSSEFVYNQYKSMAAGSSVQNLNKEKVENVVLCTPASKAEQIAIATILSDMDAEIEALETKRSKYEQVKQGMMQQLLTGKIRLID